MKRFFVPLTLALALALGACSTLEPIPVPVPSPGPSPSPAPSLSADPLTNLINKINTVLIPDLQAALADATAKGDTVAAQCYAGLIPIVQNLQTNPPIVLPPAPIGIVTAFQDARDIRAGVTGAPNALKQLRQSINLACGALQVDITAGIADPLSLFSGQ